ncbi:endonuclease-reverse transcriptase domain-containing protein [Hirsutella rhossiliensis]
MNDEDLKGYRALAISEPGFDSGNPSATRLISNGIVGVRRGEERGGAVESDFVVAGDFNRHDLLWGGDEVTARREGEAQSIIDLINDCGLCSLLPRGTKTWQGRDSESTIDLVLALAELADEMVICNIHPMEHGSDHIVFDEGGEPCVDGASLLQAEVVALLGSPAEFTNSSAWAYLNTYLLYWHVFRQESGVGSQMIPWVSRLSSKKQAPGSPTSRRISTVESACEAYAFYRFLNHMPPARFDTTKRRRRRRPALPVHRRRGGTGKSRIIEALVELFRIAAVRINSITIHSTCGFSKDQGAAANTARDPDEVRLPSKRIGSSMASFG